MGQGQNINCYSLGIQTSFAPSVQMFWRGGCVAIKGHLRASAEHRLDLANVLISDLGWLLAGIFVKFPILDPVRIY